MVEDGETGVVLVEIVDGGLVEGGAVDNVGVAMMKASFGFQLSPLGGIVAQLDRGILGGRVLPIPSLKYC